MKSKLLVGGLLALTVLAARPALAQTNDGASSQRKWAIVRITSPVKVGRQVLMGTYLVVHDDVKMAKGEPCTTIYRFDPKAGPKEQIIAFMCVPEKVLAKDTTTLAVVTDPVLGIAALQGYQFASDPEIHGVPSDAR